MYVSFLIEINFLRRILQQGYNPNHDSHIRQTLYVFLPRQSQVNERLANICKHRRSLVLCTQHTIFAEAISTLCTIGFSNKKKCTYISALLVLPDSTVQEVEWKYPTVAEGTTMLWENIYQEFVYSSERFFLCYRRCQTAAGGGFVSFLYFPLSDSIFTDALSMMSCRYYIRLKDPVNLRTNLRYGTLCYTTIFIVRYALYPKGVVT